MQLCSKWLYYILQQNFSFWGLIRVRGHLSPCITVSPRRRYGSTWTKLICLQIRPTKGDRIWCALVLNWCCQPSYPPASIAALPHPYVTQEGSKLPTSMLARSSVAKYCMILLQQHQQVKCALCRCNCTGATAGLHLTAMRQAENQLTNFFLAS